VPCGINEDAFDTAETIGNYALYLGRLDTKHKGLDDLLQAWFLLKTHGLNIPLWIVGAGKDEADLKALSLKLGVNDCVVFKGRLEGVAKKNALKNSRFLVMPSRQESFGLQPNWSSAVKLSDVNALAFAIADLWQNTEKCMVYGRAAYLEARKYVWDEIARTQQEIYLNVIQKGDC
jgi:glycosyltransferase involved in cell wall biosynthesis